MIFKMEKSFYWITHPWAIKNIVGSSSQAGYAVAEKERQKNSKCLAQSIALGYTFRPIAFEVYGRNGETKRLRHQMRYQKYVAPLSLGVSTSDIRTEWRRRLAMCFQKENATFNQKKTFSIIPRSRPDPNPVITMCTTVRRFGIDFT